MASPAAPVLILEDSVVRISFDAPAGSSVALIHVFSDVFGKQLYDYAADEKKGWLLPSGQTSGKAVPLTSRTKSVTVNNFEGGVAYAATISFRGAADIDWGPASPKSAPLTILLPVAPQAPLLEPISSTGMRVYFVKPPHCDKVDIIFHDGTSTHRVNPSLTLGPTSSGDAIGMELSARPSIDVTNLSKNLSYSVALKAHNVCWGPRGPWSKPLKLGNADFLPAPPCEPVLSAITQHSVRVKFSLLPGNPRTGSECSFASIVFKHGTETKVVDFATRTLVAPETTPPIPASQSRFGLVVSSLLPDTNYQVSLKARNAFGWSEPGPFSTFRTLRSRRRIAVSSSDVQLIGTRTAEERDAELRKNAVDVDAADADAPKAKRAKIPKSSSSPRKRKPPTQMTPPASDEEVYDGDFDEEFGGSPPPPKTIGL